MTVAPVLPFHKDITWRFCVGCAVRSLLTLVVAAAT
jgi:hypothetical protein